MLHNSQQTFARRQAPELSSRAPRGCWLEALPRGQSQLSLFPDGNDLNLYITCNCFLIRCSLFYFFLNSILALDILIVMKRC